jgi:hypothetical protein
MQSSPAQSRHDEAGFGRPASTSTRTAVLAAAGDLAVVLGFAGVGRGFHSIENPVVGVLATAWPFVVGLAVAWGALRIWRRPLPVWPAGVAAWLGAYVLGMLLRAATGGGTAPAFLLVAFATLGAFIVGWRTVAWGIGAALRRSRRGRGVSGG